MSLKDETSSRLDIKISLTLKNVIGYKYTENIFLLFIKENSDTIWTLKKRNINFGSPK